MSSWSVSGSESLIISNLKIRCEILQGLCFYHKVFLNLWIFLKGLFSINAALCLDRAIELISYYLISESSQYPCLSFIIELFLFKEAERIVIKFIFIEVGNLAWENVF